MRIRTPFKSSGERISFWNQPPNWTDVLPTVSGRMPCGASTDSKSSWPPPKLSQAWFSSAVRPKGIVVKKSIAGTSLA